MEKHLSLLLFIMVIFCACNKEIAPPTLNIGATSINIGGLSSKTKGVIPLLKNGQGTISYIVSSNKSWLRVEQFHDLKTSTSDSIVYKIIVPSTDLVEGENVGQITITSTINETLGTPVIVNVLGIFKATKISVNPSSLNVTKLTRDTTIAIKISKTGLEDANFTTTIGNSSWLSIDKPSGALTDSNTINIKIDTKDFKIGKYSNSIKINTTLAGQNFDIPIDINFDNTKNLTGTIDGHSLKTNEIWSGDVILNNDIVIPEGFTLLINPNTIIKINKKPNGDLVHITNYGNLFINGLSNQEIVIKSNLASPSNEDWGAIVNFGNLELSYAVVKNANNAVSFKNADLNSSSINSKIHHVLFDNNLISFFSYFASSKESIDYCTFRNGQIFHIQTFKSPYLNINNCDFDDETCYIDIFMESSNSNLNIINSNFKAKKATYLSHLEIGSAAKNVNVTTSNVYGLQNVNGVNSNGNSIKYTGTTNLKIVNTGCGFAEKYKSVRLKTNNNTK